MKTQYSLGYEILLNKTEIKILYHRNRAKAYNGTRRQLEITMASVVLECWYNLAVTRYTNREIVESDRLKLITLLRLNSCEEDDLTQHQWTGN